MGLCETVVEQHFPKEKVEMNAVAFGFEQLITARGGIENITTADAAEWVAESGLKLSSARRKMRFVSAACETAGIPQLLEDITYEDLDFSKDLQKHYFASFEDMIKCVSEGAAQMQTYRGDTQLVLESIVSLIWDGLKPIELLQLNAEDAPQQNRLFLKVDAGLKRISPQTYLITKQLFDLRAEHGADAPLFANYRTGERWEAPNLSEIMSRLNDVLAYSGKEILSSRIQDNGLYERIYVYKLGHHMRNTAAAVDELMHAADRKTRYAVRRSYNHWEKFYHTT